MNCLFSCLLFCWFHLHFPHMSLMWHTSYGTYSLVMSSSLLPFHAIVSKHLASQSESFLLLETCRHKETNLTISFFLFLFSCSLHRMYLRHLQSLESAVTLSSFWVLLLCPHPLDLSWLLKTTLISFLLSCFWSHENRLLLNRSTRTPLLHSLCTFSSSCLKSSPNSFLLLLLHSLLHAWHHLLSSSWLFLRTQSLGMALFLDVFGPFFPMILFHVISGKISLLSSRIPYTVDASLIPYWTTNTWLMLEWYSNQMTLFLSFRWVCHQQN